MGYLNFAASMAEVTTDSNGTVVNGIQLTVWTAAVGGTKVTDILNASGQPTGGVVTSGGTGVDAGRFNFQAPDTQTVYYMDRGQGKRTAVFALEAIRDFGTILSRMNDVQTSFDQLGVQVGDLVVASAEASTDAASAEATAEAAEALAAQALAGAGSAAAAGQLLGRTIINPTTARVDTTNSNVLSAVDPQAFNLTFKAPASGQVRIDVDVYVQLAASAAGSQNEYLILGLYTTFNSGSAGTEKAVMRRGQNADTTGQTVEGRVRYQHVMTGLLPGVVYSVQLGYRNAVSSNVSLVSGGTTVGATVMSAYAEAPVAYPGSTKTYQTPSAPVTVISDTKYNSFPGLVKAGNGDLVATYRSGAGHALGPGSIMMKRSTNGGVTWSAATTVINGGTTHDYGTATLAKLADNRIVMTTWDRDWTTTPQTLYRNGVNLYVSSDNGVTFGILRNVNTGVHLTVGSVSESPLCVAADGAWVISVYGYDAEDTTHYRTLVLRSYDEGLTWVEPSKFADAGRSFNESSVVRLPSDRLVLTVRDEIRGTWMGSYSDDNGKSWSDLQDKILCSAAPKGVVINGLIYFVGRYGTTYAARLIASDGETWWDVKTMKLPNTNRCAYGQVCSVDADTLGIIRASDDGVGPTGSTASLYWQTIDYS